MTERTTVAVNKIMNHWDSVSQSIIEQYNTGDIDREETKNALIDLLNNLMFTCEVLSTLDDTTKTLAIIINEKFEEVFYSLNK